MSYFITRLQKLKIFIFFRCSIAFLFISLDQYFSSYIRVNKCQVLWALSLGSSCQYWEVWNNGLNCQWKMIFWKNYDHICLLLIKFHKLIRKRQIKVTKTYWGNCMNSKWSEKEWVDRVSPNIQIHTMKKTVLKFDIVLLSWHRHSNIRIFGIKTLPKNILCVFLH